MLDIEYMEPPVISFVIPAYNEEDYVLSAISSIKAQQLSVPYEIIVVDNASTDHTAQVASIEGVLVVHEEKKGQPMARQKGFEEARGEYIIYIDADTILPLGFAEKILTYFKNHPDVVCVSTNISFYDGGLEGVFGSFIFRFVFLPWTRLWLFLLRRTDVVLGPFIGIRRAALLKAGGIDTKVMFYGEDTSIAIRMATQGKVQFLSHLHVLTSARRYKSQGITKTLSLYFAVFFLMQIGWYNLALAFSKKFSP